MQDLEMTKAAFESVRLAVASPTLRASLFASVRDIHELDIDILMRLHAEHPKEGFGAAALFTSEQGRALNAPFAAFLHGRRHPLPGDDIGLDADFREGRTLYFPQFHAAEVRGGGGF